MRRRHVLATFAVGFSGLGGCVGEPPGGTETVTRTSPGTQTQATALGTIEYTVTNEDDETYRLQVTMENDEGGIVQETTEPEFGPGSSVSSGDAGHQPDMGPYTLTFDIGSTSATHVWDVRECARIDLRVTITAEGEVTIQRKLCQN